MKHIINSVTKFAIDLLLKTIALAIELHLSVTRKIKTAALRKPMLRSENDIHAKSSGDEPGPVASGPDSHLTENRFASGAGNSIGEFNTRTRRE
jgi:hypothetical protein